MRHVLIVDDDPAVVAGLRRGLRSHADWLVEGAVDGKGALALLGGQTFDVVVSDAQMPGLDGEGLLRELLARWPATLRVILSGQLHAGQAERLWALAQHVIPKPVKPARLYQLIEDALSARERLLTPELRTLVGELGALPALPRLYHQLVAVLSRPAYEVADLVALVQRDPGTSANLLKLVNSAWFGLPKPVASLKDAIIAVGASSLQGLVLGAGVFSGNSALATHLMGEAMARWRYVSALAERTGAADWRETAHTAAVVCDVARLVLAERRPDDCARCEERTLLGEDPETVEAELFGADHAAIGAALLGEWGLPREVVDAVRLHHRPQTRAGAGAALALASLALEPPPGAHLSSTAALFGLSPEAALELGAPR